MAMYCASGQTRIEVFSAHSRKIVISIFGQRDVRQFEQPGHARIVIEFRGKRREIRVHRLCNWWFMETPGAREVGRDPQSFVFGIPGFARHIESRRNFRCTVASEELLLEAIAQQGNYVVGGNYAI